MKVLVLSTMVPFVHGGAEELFHNLVHNLKLTRGVEAEGFRIPFTWDPPEQILNEMQIARQLRLWNVDRVIALKFPTYLVPWKSKVVWLLHQFRQAYDLRDAGQSNLPFGGRGDVIASAVRAADNIAFAEASAIFTNSPTTSGRLQKYNAFASKILRPPLNDPDRFGGGDSQGYILATGRVNAAKRQYLLVSALKFAPGVRLVVAGPADTPADQAVLEELAAKEGVSDRLRLELRFLQRAELAELVNGAQAVAYLPYDEDSLGYCTMEALWASKPVLTATDSGGVLDIVRDGETGLVVPPLPEALGAAMLSLSAGAELALRLGKSGRHAMVGAKLDWPSTIERLLG